MAYTLSFGHVSASGTTTASWVEGDAGLPVRKRLARVCVSRPTLAEVRAWAADHGLPWDEAQVTGSAWDG